MQGVPGSRVLGVYVASYYGRSFPPAYHSSIRTRTRPFLRCPRHRQAIFDRAVSASEAELVWHVHLKDWRVDRGA